MILFDYIALAVVTAVVAYLINRLRHPEWLTVSRTIVLVLVLVVLGAVIQSAVSEPSSGSHTAGDPPAPATSTVDTPSPPVETSSPATEAPAAQTTTPDIPSTQPSRDAKGLRIFVAQLESLKYPGWGAEALTATISQVSYPQSLIGDVARGGGCADTQVRQSEFSVPAGQRFFEATFGLDDSSQDATTVVRAEVLDIQGGASRTLFSAELHVGKATTTKNIDIRNVSRLGLKYSFIRGTGSFSGCNEALVVAGTPVLVS